MPCLDENTAVAFVQRRLSEQERRAVEEHVDECADCLAITCAIVRSRAPTHPDFPEEVEPQYAGVSLRALRRGDVVGRYTLLEMIGYGAMGSVYAAHDPKLDRKVAVKVVRADRIERADAHERLSREARAMAKLSHPNVVAVHDVGEVEGGVFVAMEFVEGVTLAVWLHERERPWRDVLRVFLEAGKGLAAAHAAGIVHRGLQAGECAHRPLRPRGRDRLRCCGSSSGRQLHRVPIRSSQLRRDSLAKAPLEASLTKTGMLIGTPRYMSPEQYAWGKPRCEAPTSSALLSRSSWQFTERRLSRRVSTASGRP